MKLRALCLSMLLGLTALGGGVFVSPVAADAPSCGDVSYAGDGTSVTPYDVGNVEQLQCIGKNHADADSQSDALDSHYQLVSDIDASGTSEWNTGDGFEPIWDPNSEISFSGSFNGSGHVISDLTIDQPSTNDKGLFGKVDAGSTVGNVTLTDVDITGDVSVGAVVGSNSGTVRNVSMTGSVSGVVNTGGLVGFNAGGTVINGSADGTVTGNDNRAGGLVGDNTGTVNGSFADATVTYNGDSGIGFGGLVGSNRGLINKSYATGDVKTTAGSSGGEDFGGVVGRNGGGRAGVSGSGDINNSYATGTVGGSGDVGGLVGQSTELSTLKQSYWDTQSTGQSSAIGKGETVDTLNGLTTSEMQGSAAQSNMTAFDFTTTWAAQVDDYPTFQWQTQTVTQTVEYNGNIEVTFTTGVIANATATDATPTAITTTTDRAGYGADDGNWTVDVGDTTYNANAFTVTAQSGTNGGGKDVTFTITPNGDAWDDPSPSTDVSVTVPDIQFNAAVSDGEYVREPGTQTVTTTSQTISGGGSNDTKLTARNVTQGEVIALQGSQGEEIEIRRVGDPRKSAANFGNSTIQVANTSTYSTGATYRVTYGSSADQYFNVTAVQPAGVKSAVEANGTVELVTNKSARIEPDSLRVFLDGTEVYDAAEDSASGPLDGVTVTPTTGSSASRHTLELTADSEPVDISPTQNLTVVFDLERGADAVAETTRVNEKVTTTGAIVAESDGRDSSADAQNIYRGAPVAIWADLSGINTGVYLNASEQDLSTGTNSQLLTIDSTNQQFATGEVVQVVFDDNGSNVEHFKLREPGPTEVESAVEADGTVELVTNKSARIEPDSLRVFLDGSEIHNASENSFAGPIDDIATTPATSTTASRHTLELTADGELVDIDPNRNLTIAFHLQQGVGNEAETTRVSEEVTVTGAVVAESDGLDSSEDAQRIYRGAPVAVWADLSLTETDVFLNATGQDLSTGPNSQLFTLDSASQQFTTGEVVQVVFDNNGSNVEHFELQNLDWSVTTNEKDLTTDEVAEVNVSANRGGSPFIVRLTDSSGVMVATRQPTLGDDAETTVTFDPATIDGFDAGTYTASATDNRTNNTDMVGLTVTASNQQPEATDDTYTTTENTTLSRAAPGVLENDTDPDSDSLTAAVNTAPSHGDLTLADNGSFAYTPDTGFTETDSFTYQITDGSGGADTATVTIQVTPRGSVSLNQSNYTEVRGDVAAIGLELNNTDTATVTIGTVADNNWAQNVTVEDGNGDGFVTLEFNSYTAGTADNGYPVYSAASDGDSVANVALGAGPFGQVDTPAEDTLAAGEYRIGAVAGDTAATQTSDGADNLGTLSLRERSTKNIETFTAPDARLSDIESVSDIESLRETHNITEASDIGTDDGAVFKIDASGLEGVLKNQTDSGYDNDTAAFLAEAPGYIDDDGETHAWEVTIRQTNPGPNTAPYTATLNVDNTDLYVDAAADEYWLVVDTDRVPEFTEGDRLTTEFTTRDEDDINDGNTTVPTFWAFTGAQATVDTNADLDNDGDADEVTVRKASSQEIAGTTTVAPGTELSLRIYGTDTGSPFVKPLTTVVEPDGSWTVTPDFSNNAQGANFTVDVRRGSDSLIDGIVDGRIAAPPTATVTFNDQKTFGELVTVDSVTTSDGGFIALHRDNASGEVVGTSQYIESGSDSDVDMVLDEELSEDTRLVAMPHQDTDGDEEYEFEFGSNLDAPYPENGSSVTDAASITVVDSDEVATTTTEMGTETETGTETGGGATTTTMPGGDSETSDGGDGGLTTTSAGGEESEDDQSEETTAPTGPSDSDTDTEAGGDGSSDGTTTTTGPGFGLVLTVGTLLGIAILAVRRSD